MLVYKFWSVVQCSHANFANEAGTLVMFLPDTLQVVKIAQRGYLSQGLDLHCRQEIESLDVGSWGHES